MKKYKFDKYDKKYPYLFEKEKYKLKNLLASSKIEHIGSTAIPSLGGKGIIDILISVPKKELKKVKNKLINKGYIFKESGGDSERLFFEKDYGIFRKRRIHIQLTFNNSNIWKKSIKFRNVLVKDKKLREEYSLIKETAVKLGKERKEYRDFKKEFIENVLR
ncbi:MAG: GrpB family protein [Candidatus Nanoarchaeia archaeon]|nr:GrpB family protein [Candidatus Nanoarchaeia archaeon]MDD5741091.1 GrpB family protein [Candidatus Nanoarchaeia archaeon]